MSLISQSMTIGSSLLEHRRLKWTRSRPGTPTKDAETGYSTPGAPSTGTVWAFFSWIPERERADYQADAAAYLLAPPGSLQPGDTVSNPDVGQFVVMDGGVKPQGEADRVELKRSG